MKFLVVLALIGCAAAQGPKYSATQAGNEIVITRSENENDGNGNFKWLSELSDGTKLEQSGYTKPSNDPENPIIQVITGAVSYTAPDGQLISLTYTADENGFVPVGNHLPTPPPVPEALLKAHAAAASNISPQYSPAPAGARFQQARRF